MKDIRFNKWYNFMLISVFAICAITFGVLILCILFRHNELEQKLLLSSSILALIVSLLGLFITIKRFKKIKKIHEQCE